MFDKNQPAYRHLREIYAEKTKQIIAWTGAGLSIEAGLPSWRKLRDILCSAVERTAIHFPEEQKRKTLLLMELAKAEHDLWLGFEHLKNALGPTSYRAEIKSAFAPADKAPTPRVYKMLWELEIRGILNLNLDGLASRASADVFQGSKRVVEFSGKATSGYSQTVLSGGSPFIANLHGVIEDDNSWIFTKPQLQELFQTNGFLEFISVLIQTRAFLFMGISADDVAAGGHLERLREKGINFADHFWLTDRNDANTIEWAERAGLRMIFYEARDNNHQEMLEALAGLPKFVSTDDTPPPVVPKAVVAKVTLSSPEDVERKHPEEIRTELNAEAVKILSSGSDCAERYETFCEKYSEAIYRAWSVNTGDRNRTLFGYKIQSEHARGAFGRVYSALSPTGEKVAIKVLHVDVRHDKRMLDSFRRGVRSMQILEKSTVFGMVPYKFAWEIPTCTVMEFIEGPNLEEAVQEKYINDWPEIIRVSKQLARIIRSAHLLPERVLHRDIRPANIMLKDYYADPETLEVVVLDFDLSWHRDASGHSIDWSQSVSGFIAPELTGAEGTDSRRSALVDSFGIGMTFFYLAARERPLFLQHKDKDWGMILRAKIITSRPCSRWLSLPTRYARLVEWSTRHKQTERWDMTRIFGELQRLEHAYGDPDSVVSAEMLAEELCARCSIIADNYSWHGDRNEAHAVLATSRAEIRFVGNETTRRVEFRINWVNSGESAYQNIAKYVQRARDQSYAALKKAGWRVEGAKLDVRDAGIDASYDIRELKGKLSAAATAANETIRLFQFQ